MTRKQKKSLIRIIISAVLFAAGLIFTRVFTLPWWAELLIFLPAYLISGARGGVKRIALDRKLVVWL